MVFLLIRLAIEAPLGMWLCYVSEKVEPSSTFLLKAFRKQNGLFPNGNLQITT